MAQSNDNDDNGAGLGDDFFDDHKLSIDSPPPSTVGGRNGGGNSSNNKKKNNNNRRRNKHANNNPQQNSNSNAHYHYNHQHSHGNELSPHQGGHRSRDNSPCRRGNKSRENSPHGGRTKGNKGGNKSRDNSPNRNKGGANKQQQQHGGHHHTHPYHNHQHSHNQNYYYNKKNNGPPDIAVIVNRVDLYDSAANIRAVALDDAVVKQPPAGQPPIAHFSFAPDAVAQADATMAAGGQAPTQTDYSHAYVGVLRVPYSVKYVPCHLDGGDGCGHTSPHCDDVVVDNTTPNPINDPSIDKYWAQRRRLFAKFDQGIQLDQEGWFSVTPEIIADHVAKRVGEMANKEREQRLQLEQELSAVLPAEMASDHHPNPKGGGMIILDAFCGCGGNGIAFGKMPFEQIALVVCVDTDRQKLRMAAHNAAIYHIPPTQIAFVECNSVFIMKYCYRNGEFILDQPEKLIAAGMPMQLPNPVPTEVCEGYHIGGINMLPRRIDAVFMDPPWGGVDYEVLGKNGYDLEKNMKIRCLVCLQQAPGAAARQHQQETPEDTLHDDFFDSFCPKPQKTNVKSKKANFNNDIVDDYVNGAELLRLAAAATRTRVVLYDMPRNTNKTSLGQAALAAGYRGNMKLEEHFLNGRLKTITAYFGDDFAALIQPPSTLAQQEQPTGYPPGFGEPME